MSVHYKFKSTLDFETITFDGLHISVSDLKRAIVKQKRLGKLTDFDLQITNAQTKEEYSDENTLIPKNTSLIIARVPLSHQVKKSWENGEKSFEIGITAPKTTDSIGLDITKMSGSEEDKIQAMMLQSTADYDPKSYQKIRSQTGEVPPTYRCNKCKKGGHWIKNCPFNLTKEFSEVKRSTGIPKSFQNRDEKQMDLENKEQQSNLAPNSPEEIPEDLICGICHDLFTDAVMIPCCGSSFCDDCVRTALLESEENECPDCKEKGSSPASLIPNRFLRNSVNNYKNATGYNAKELKKATKIEPTPPPVKESEIQLPEPVTKEEAKQEVQVEEEEVEEEESKKEAEEEEEEVEEKEEEEEEETQCEEPAKEIPLNESPIKPEMEPTKESSESDDGEDKETKVNPNEEADSDYEDNITIKMPPAQLGSQTNLSLREKTSSEQGSSRHLHPPGIESSPPQRPTQEQKDTKQRSPSNHHGKSARGREFRESYVEKDAFTGFPPHVEVSSGDHYARDLQDRRQQPKPTHDMYRGPHVHGMGYQQMNSHHPMNPGGMQPQHMLPFNNVFNQMDPRSNIGYTNFPRQPFPNIRQPYMQPMRGPPNDVRHGPTPHPSSLASVYQGVAAKVGTGIIDDPLEAFNRIMREKEKEKRKDERRRTPEQRRSRSSERHQRSRYRVSPVNRRIMSRELSTRDRHERREYDRENTNIRDRDRDRFIKIRRSTSFNDRNSRSRSRSISPARRRSRSPLHYRRSRSKPHISKERRSRSHGRSRGHRGINMYPSVEEKSLRKNMNRSPNHGKPIDDFQSWESISKPMMYAQKMETMEPPPPGFELTSSENLHWHHRSSEKQQQQQQVFENSPESLFNPNLKSEKAYSREERISRTSSGGGVKPIEMKPSRVRSISPLKKSLENKKKHESFSPKATVVEEKQEKVMVSIRTGKNDKDHHRRHSLEIRDTKSNSDKDAKNLIIKKNGKETKCETPTQSEKESITPAKVCDTLSSLVGRSAEQKSRTTQKEEKHGKERKKKSKREKTGKKKMKKDKKEKRVRNRQTSIEETNSPQEEKEQSIEISETADDRSSKRRSSTQSKDYFHEKSRKAHDYTTNIITAGKEEWSIEAIETNEILYDDLMIEENKSSKTMENHKKNTSADSVLDIHVYDTDFDETAKPEQNQGISEQKIIVPALSKWELDDQNLSSNNISLAGNESNNIFVQGSDFIHNNDKVTNEVLRKAENAIFTRAINAIRPIDTKKSSTSYSNYIEDSPPSNRNNNVNRKDSIISHCNLKDFQITVPLGSAQEQRSVEVRQEIKTTTKSHSPNRSKPSIRDRLGSKIIYKDHISPHTDNDFNTNTEEKNKRERSTERKNRSNHREVNYKLQGRSREREREREREKEREQEKEKERVRVRSRSRDRDRYKSSRDHRERDHHGNKRGGEVVVVATHHKSQREEKSSRFEKESRKNEDENVAGNRLQSEYVHSGRIRHNKDDNSKTTTRNDNEQSASHEGGSSHRRRDSSKNRQKTCEINYLEQRVASNPFRQTDAIRNPVIRESSDKDMKRTTRPAKQEATGSRSSPESETEMDSDELKRKKKRKDRKEKKRIKRFSSVESSGSSRKKHKRKKSKSSKKAKKE